MNAQYGTLEYYPSVLAVRRYSYRLGLRPESVPLRSRAFDRRFSRALAAGLVPRPTPCLSPCAHPWGRASSPSRATLNCARFAGTRGGEEIKKKCFSSGQHGFTFCCLLLNSFIPPEDSLFLAAISACRLLL